MNSIRFGTDGWRAIIGEEYTFDNVRRVAQATAEEFQAQGGRRTPTLVVGYDSRFLSDRFAQTTAEVLAGNRCQVLLSDRPVPTPLVSFAIKHGRLQGGVMITASHNPSAYNGFKVKAHFAGSIDPAVARQIEERLDKQPVQRIPLDEALRRRLIRRVDLTRDYLTFLPTFVDLRTIRRAKLHVLSDTMHGVGSGYLPTLLKGGRCRLTAVRDTYDPLFGGVNPEPISSNLAPSIQAIRRGRFDLGVINDGDADRIGALRPNGDFIDPGQILALLLLHLVEDRGWRGGVVRTISNTTLIDRMASAYKLPLHETPVGFKHICQLMLTQDILIGGEESGGIGITRYLPDRDGILLALLLIELLAQRGESFAQIWRGIERRFGRLASSRVDLHIELATRDAALDRLRREPPKRLLSEPITDVKMFDGVKLIARDGSWILFRPSGTEPILRIYAEGASKTHVQSLLRAGQRLVT